MLVSMTLIAGVARTTRAAFAAYPIGRASAGLLFSMAMGLFYRGSPQDVYNILWAVVFGFATLNILGLAARRMEPSRRGLSFGELLAVMVVVLSILLLTWEILTFLHIFPIKLRS